MGSGPAHLAAMSASAWFGPIHASNGRYSTGHQIVRAAETRGAKRQENKRGVLTPFGKKTGGLFFLRKLRALIVELGLILYTEASELG